MIELQDIFNQYGEVYRQNHSLFLNQLKAMVGKKIERNIRVNYRGKEYCVFDIYPEVGEIGQTITEEEIEKISVLYIVPVKNIADTNF